MKAITAFSTIFLNIHIKGWLNWVFTYFHVLPSTAYVQTRIVPCLCVDKVLIYPPQVIFVCQSCISVCILLWQSVLYGYLSSTPLLRIFPFGTFSQDL